MSIERVSPRQAAELMKDQDYVYLDVRSVPEFEQAHPDGALNVPLLHRDPVQGMVPNPEFMSVVEKILPSDTKVIVGCASGGRSLRAAELLIGRGYTHVVDQRAGFGGARDQTTGEVVEPGWAACDLPVEEGAPEGRNYEELRKQAKG